MANAVRFLSVLAFATQFAWLWLYAGILHDQAAAILCVMLSSGLLIPLFAASSRRPYVNLALLVAFAPVCLLTWVIVRDTMAATNSTAALGFLVLPILQSLCFVIAALIGWVTDRARRFP